MKNVRNTVEPLFLLPKPQKWSDFWRVSQGFRTAQRPCHAFVPPFFDGLSGWTLASGATYRTCDCCPLPLLTLTLFRSWGAHKESPRLHPQGLFVPAQTVSIHFYLGQSDMDYTLGAALKFISFVFWSSYSLGHQSKLNIKKKKNRFEKLLHALVKIWHPFGYTESVFMLAFQLVLYHRFPMAVKTNTTM